MEMERSGMRRFGSGTRSFDPGLSNIAGFGGDVPGCGTGRWNSDPVRREKDAGGLRK